MEELIGVLNYTDLKVNSSGGGDLSNYYTKDETDNQIKKSIDKIKVPTKVSELSNDAGYLTEHQSLTEYAKKTEIPTVPTNVSAFTNDAGYLTEHQSLADYSTTAQVQTMISSAIGAITNGNEVSY